MLKFFKNTPTAWKLNRLGFVFLFIGIGLSDIFCVCVAIVGLSLFTAIAIAILVYKPDSRLIIHLPLDKADSLAYIVDCVD